MAHARRKFYEAQTSSKPLAGEALLLIQELYAIERRAAAHGNEERCQLRQTEARPLLEKLRDWLNEQRMYALPKSLIGKATTYALKNCAALCEYIADGELTIDNNRSVGREVAVYAGGIPLDLHASACASDGPRS